MFVSESSEAGKIAVLTGSKIEVIFTPCGKRIGGSGYFVYNMSKPNYRHFDHRGKGKNKQQPKTWYSQ